MFQKLLKRMRDKPVFGWVICYSLVSTIGGVVVVQVPISAPLFKFTAVCLLLIPQIVLPFLELILLYREKRIRTFFLVYLRLAVVVPIMGFLTWFSNPGEPAKLAFIPFFFCMPFCLIGSWCKRMVKLGHI